MRWIRTLACAAAALLLAAPASAAVKALTLRELMQITTDAIDGQIVAKETFRVDHEDYEGLVFTRVTVEGESMRTGEPLTETLVYLGSHDPEDGFVSSEMPLFQDVRLGNRVAVFFGRDEANLSGENQVWGFNCVFRIETVLGQPVVMGKGEGMAFRDNVALADARAAVRQIHLELEAAEQALPGPAVK